LLKGTSVPLAIEEANGLTQDRDSLLDQLRTNFLKAQDQMQVYANKHRRDVNLVVDDWVYLKLQPYRLKSLAKKLNEKLSP